MYSVLAKYGSDYAIMNSDTSEIEVLTERDLCIVLYFGTQIKGVSFDGIGNLVETETIRVLSKEDIYRDEDDNETVEFDYEDSEEYEDTEEYEDLEEYEYSEEYEDLEDSEDEEEYEDFEDYEDTEEYEDEDEYEEEEYYDYDKSDVGKLYDMLSPDQEKLLKRYYLWYSQRLFSEAQKDPTFGMKDKNRIKAKKEQLDSLKLQGGMWHYAGFIDTGYDGGGYCTLGHRLRYLHIAWDITQSDIEATFFGQDYDKDIEEIIENNSDCIIFGIKCISDFFEVDKTCTQNLQRAQRESIKDMEQMYSYYMDGIVDEVCDSFSNMDTFVKRIKIQDMKNSISDKDYKPILRNGLAQFYLQFRELGMPVPKSLVQEMRDNIIGWESHKFTGFLGNPVSEVFSRNLCTLFGKHFKDYESMLMPVMCNNLTRDSWHMGVFEKYIIITFMYEICGYYKYNGKTMKDEGGSSYVVRTNLLALYRIVNNSFFTDVEYTYEYMLKVISLAPMYAELYSAISELNDYYEGLDYQLRYSGDEIVTKVDRIVRDLCYLSRIYYKSYDSVSIITGERMSLVSAEGVLRADIDTVKSLHTELISYCESKKEKVEDAVSTEDIEVTDATSTEEEQSDSQEVSLSDNEIIEYLRDANLESVPSNMSFNKSVLETVLKRGPASRNQMYYIKKLYEYLSGNKLVTDNTSKKYNIDDFKDYAKAIKYILDENEKDIVYKVCSSVSKYGTFTEKQKKYLDMAMERYDSRR